MFFVFIKKMYSKELKRRIDFSGHDLFINTKFYSLHL